MNQNDEQLAEVVKGLLRVAADAWAAGAIEAAERVTRGAWQVLEGRDFIDTADKHEDAGR
jgi:hypothetical protein